ncbi:MAG TPA: hypothetical protein TECP_00964 [Hyphomicrobiaceae bacterium MAG_BT-2024]
MANGKDGSDKKNPKKGGKPSTSVASPKKPIPIIELKATEIMDADGAKIAESRHENDGKQSKIQQSKDTQKNIIAKPSLTAPDSTVDADKRLKAGHIKKNEPESIFSGSRKKSEPPEKKNDTIFSSNKLGQAPKQHNGIRFFLFCACLIAGMVGSLIILIGAHTLAKELGMYIIPHATMPAELEERLAALENRPLINPEDITSVDKTHRLSLKIDNLTKRLEDFGELRQQVNRLNNKIIQVSQQDNTSEAVEKLNGISGRVIKLEMTIKNLIKATGPNGRPTTLASLTSLSDKLSDVETSLQIELGELHRAITKDTEAQLFEITQLSNAARSATKRIDKDLSHLRNSAAQLELRAETIQLAQKNTADKVRAISKAIAGTRVELDNFKTNVNERLTIVVRPSDVSGAIAPMSKRLTALHSEISQITTRESERKTNLKRIVMALQLGNLKRAMNRGGDFSTELQEVNRIVENVIDLSPLEKFKAYGVPTMEALQLEFTKLAHKLISSAEKPERDNLIAHFLKGAQTLVHLRRTDLPDDDNSIEAIVSRVEKLLSINDLASALDELKKIPSTSLKHISVWISKAKAKLVVDQAIAKIEQQLISSLSATANNRG